VRKNEQCSIFKSSALQLTAFAIVCHRTLLVACSALGICSPRASVKALKQLFNTLEQLIIKYYSHEIKGAKMTNKPKLRNKVQNLYLNDKTHSTLKALAAHQESTIQATAAHWLEEIQPIMQEMVQAFDDIKGGENTQKVLQNFIAKSLHMAADSLEIDDKDEK
jgi:hypothetical protein